MGEPSETNFVCETIRQRLSAYLDDELPESSAHDIAEHLERCKACRREAEELGALWNALEDSDPVLAPITLAESVLRRLEKEERGNDDISTLFSFRRLLPVSAAVAVVCLVVGGLLGHTLMEKEAANNGQRTIAETLDIFAPAPRGTLANGYFAMMQNPGS